jgi:deoxycytidylate deaminase
VPAIVDDDGEVIALGTNEVPKGDGGQYWPDDTRDDGRDFALRRDIAFERKQRALDQFLRTLGEKGKLLDPPLAPPEVWDLLKGLTAEDVWGLLQGTDFMNVTEYGRATHAEMAALVHSARRGRSVQDATLYTTTFPCHVCARHIVQAGIARVVYNEPYPKSLTLELHNDSVTVGPAARHHVLFEPFVGISPTLYADAFRVPRGSRRTDEGSIRVWTRPIARPIRSADPRSYLAKELRVNDERLGPAEAQPVRRK